MRRILLCMAVIAALGACGGGHKKSNTKAAGNLTTESTAPGATDAQAGSGAGAAAAPSTTAPKAATATTAKAGSTAAGSTGAGGTTGGGGSAGTSGSSGTVGSAPSMTAVAAGHYHYAVTGTSNVGSVPPGEDLTVDAPQGNSQHTRMTTQSQNGGSTTDTTLDKESDGAHLVDLTTVNNTPFGPVTIAFHPSPPPRLQPQPLAPGSSVGPFDMTSTDGKTIATLKVTIQAVNEAVALGDGSSVATVRVEIDTTLRCATGQSCPFTGTINSTRWLRSDGLMVKDHSITDGTFSGIKVNSDTTALVDKGSPS